jgi:NAD-dependent deacetylase
MSDRAPFTSELTRRLSEAEHVTVLTGAGISAESGVPTFRDEGGLWQQFKPEELANVNAFLQNPRLVQGWYAHRKAVINETRPNPGHYALVDLENLIPDFTLVTQNVDNLHRRAGSRNVVELHGNIMRSYCIRCKKEATEGEMAPIADGMPAVCSECGGLIRPDVVWFGEFLPEGAMAKATDAAYRSDVFLSIGTSAIVYPAAGIPGIAAGAGAYLVEINVQPSAIADSCDEVILGKAGEVLPQLVEAVRALRAG